MNDALGMLVAIGLMIGIGAAFTVLMLRTEPWNRKRRG
jgi:hypothetical protein